ncbi:YIP1 family protein [Halocalculus aciditolerans]|nr:YIP1 family protein [Halocalculus aciditolerans]
MQFRQSLHALFDLLVRPDAFFERDGAWSLGRAFGVVLAVSAVTTAAVAAMGWLFTSNIDATVTVTTMEPWSDATCESFAEMNSTPEPCTIDEPQTKQVSVGAKVWSAFVGRLPFVFVASLLGWVLVAAALHAATWLLGGEGSFAGTLTVAGWAVVPTIVQAAFALVGFTLLVRGTAFSNDPEVLVQQLRTLSSSTGNAWAAVGGLVAGVWQAYIWTHGLAHARSLRVSDAAVAAGIVAVVTIALSLV